MSHPADFRVRWGEPRDIRAIAAFNVHMAQETEKMALDPVTVSAGVRGLIEHPERGFYLVVETGQAEKPALVAALMVTREWSDWRNATFWWIQSVYVVPEYRRRGLYRSLYDQVQELAAQESGVCGFRLYVDKHNHTAQSTYHALGMSETGYRIFEQPALQTTA